MAKVYAELANRVTSPTGDYIYDEQKALRPIAFIERFCKHSKGEWAGKPLVLELWQKAFVSALFGFVHKETGLRQYKEAMLMVGRKNGKTTMLAGIALYMLVADGEAGAEIYSVATKKDQARLVFDETYNMVQQSGALSNVIRKRKTDLYFSDRFSKFQPLAKNSDTLDGLNSHLVIIDELHGIRNRELYEVMKQSLSARQQGLLIMITTAGTVRENIFDNMYDYATNIVDGKFEDDSFLPIIYELDEREEYTDPDKWHKANPALGTIKKIEYIENQVMRAQNSPSMLRGVLVKDFNIRENTSGSWLSYEVINNTDTFDVKDFEGHFAIGGVDLSRTGDLTCATLLIMDRETEQRYVHQMYWLPEDNFNERVNIEKIPYDIWLEQGLLRLCEGNLINYSDVTAWFIEMVQEYGLKIAWVYYDPYSAQYFVEEMENTGFEMVKTYQGAKTLSSPMERLGADLASKKINYNNNPMLKWCISNTGITEDRNGNILPIKSNQPKQRIDGMASLLISYVGLMDHYEEFRLAQPEGILN